MEEKKILEKIGLIKKMIALIQQILGLQRELEKKKLEEMIRRVAAEERVDGSMILAVIKCESGLNPRAVNKNKNGTTDYGLCQFNDYWYREFITPEEALNQPEKAVRLMCHRFRQGYGNDWICYRSGKWLKFLS